MNTLLVTLLYLIVLTVVFVSSKKQPDSSEYNKINQRIDMSLKEYQIIDINKYNKVADMIVLIFNDDLIINKRERIVYLLRDMIHYGDTTEFLENNIKIHEYIFTNTA